MIIKKIFLAGAILYTSSNLALAGTTYVGGGLGLGEYHSQSGANFNLFGGYGTTLKQNPKIYLGGELGANVGYYGNMKYGINASFLPGVMVTDNTMVYTRLGVNVVHSSSSNDILSFAPQYGMGVQTNISENWDVRGEYTKTTVRNTGQFNLGLVYKFK